MAMTTAGRQTQDISRQEVASVGFIIKAMNEAIEVKRNEHADESIRHM